MTDKMVWSEEQGKMVKVGASKEESVKVSVTVEQADTLKGFAQADGFDFSGVSYVTVKDKDGKTKTTADGKPVYEMENDKPKMVAIEESVARVNSAISQYVNVAIRKLIAERNDS